MKKSLFKLALIVLAIAALQSCNGDSSNDILDPDVPLTAESIEVSAVSGDQVGAYCAGMESVLSSELNS